MKQMAKETCFLLFMLITVISLYAEEKKILIEESPIQVEEIIENQEAVPESEVTSPEDFPPRPRWFEKAEKAYITGVKAFEAGNRKEAQKKFKTALKLLASKSDQAALLGVKDEIIKLFSKVEENIIDPPEIEDPLLTPGEEISEQELQDAKAAETPAAALSSKYTILIDPENPLTKKYITVFTGKHHARMQAALDRMGMYEDMILLEIKKTGVPRELLYLPLVESMFKNRAVSRASAVGLWQFMSFTGKKYGLKVNYWIDERRNSKKATKAALAHLKDLYEWFDDWHLALAAYNRGVYGVQRDMRNTRSPDFGALTERRGLPRETENYVPKFMAFVLIADNMESYGFTRETRIPPLEYDTVPLEKPLDLEVAARCAGTSKSIIQELNPTVRLWCTPKNDKTFYLKIPKGTKAQFSAMLSQVKNWNPGPEIIRYRVKRGDYLGLIARKYRTTIRSIQKLNRIRNPRFIRVGQRLKIRPGRRYYSRR